jgi:two-component system, response regulator / RNA-binding antiterminator
MQGSELSIVIVDDNRLRAAIIEDGLREAGHSRVTVITETNEVARRIVEISPDVVVIDLENPDRDRLEHFFTLSKALQRPVAMFVDKSDAAEIEAAIEAGVSAYVVDGLRRDRVKSILDMAVLRFNAYARLQHELDEARGALEERKQIDKAKSILMTQKKLTEAEAYSLLRKTAMNQNRRIVEIAQSLITAAGLLEP